MMDVGKDVRNPHAVTAKEIPGGDGFFLAESKPPVPLEPLLSVKIFSGFENYKCHVNWISKADKLTERLANNIIKVLIDKVPDPSDGLSDALEHLGFEIICNRITLGFLHVLLGKHIDAQFHLITANTDINTLKDYKFMDVEYIEGLRYVHKGVTLFNCLHRERESLLKKCMKIKEDLDYFATLSHKSQVCVSAVQQYFFGQLRRGHAAQIELLKKITSMDPDCFLWHFNLFSQYRYQRREKIGKNRPGPSGAEIKEILRASKLSPNHPLVLAGSCICLAEIIKTRKNDNEIWQPLRYGQHEFTSIQFAVDFVNLQAKQLMDLHQETDRINISIADCFSIILPYEHRNMELARECIQRTLQFHPGSSKGHHRMGHFILVTTGNVEDTIHHLLQAITCDSRNFPAKADLIKAYMSNSQKYSQEILDLFSSELQNPDHNSARISNLHFLKGFFFLLLLDQNHPEYESDAAAEWLKAFELAGDCLDFKGIFYTAKLYKWPKIKLTFKIIHTAILTLIKSKKVDPANKYLIELEKIALNNKIKAIKHYLQTRGCSGTVQEAIADIQKDMVLIGLEKESC